MEIESKVVDKDQNIVVIVVKGPIIRNNIDPLENQLETFVEGRAVKLILDLQKVESIDSQGVGLLIKARFDIVNNAGKIVLAGLTDRVRAVLRVSGLEDYFLIAADEEKALQLLHA
ncbi:STAS domain-containing protein [bacterium]|nr:STAS domain-containing protein [bacterium]